MKCQICQQFDCVTPEECQYLYNIYSKGDCDQCTSCELFHTKRVYGFGINMSNPPSRWYNVECLLCGEKSERRLEYVLQ